MNFGISLIASEPEQVLEIGGSSKLSISALLQSPISVFTHMSISFGLLLLSFPSGLGGTAPSSRATCSQTLLLVPLCHVRFYISP